MKKVCVLISVLILALSSRMTAQRSGAVSSKQEKPETFILFVFDASNSMYGLWQSDRKINIAKKLLSEVLDSLAYTPNVQYALRVYGHLKSFPHRIVMIPDLRYPLLHPTQKRLKEGSIPLFPKELPPLHDHLNSA